MYKFNRSKMFKLIAMVMVVAMLASAMMLEAFAASVTTTVNGYTVYSYIAKDSNHSVFVDVTYDVSAVLQANLDGYYKHSSTGERRNIDASGSANHYALTVRVQKPGTGFVYYWAWSNPTVNGTLIGRVENSYGV